MRKPRVIVVTTLGHRSPSSGGGLDEHLGEPPEGRPHEGEDHPQLDDHVTGKDCQRQDAKPRGLRTSYERTNSGTCSSIHRISFHSGQFSLYGLYYVRKWPISTETPLEAVLSDL